MYDDSLDIDIKGLLNGMLDRNPKTRFDIDQVVSHPAIRKNMESFEGPISGDDYTTLIRNFLMNSPTGLTADAPQEVLKFAGFEEQQPSEWVNLQEEFKNTGYIIGTPKVTYFQKGLLDVFGKSEDNAVNDFSPPPFGTQSSPTWEQKEVQKSFKKQQENPAKKVIKIDNGADAWMESMERKYHQEQGKVGGEGGSGGVGGGVGEGVGKVVRASPHRNQFGEYGQGHGEAQEAKSWRKNESINPQVVQTNVPSSPQVIQHHYDSVEAQQPSKTIRDQFAWLSNRPDDNLTYKDNKDLMASQNDRFRKQNNEAKNVTSQETLEVKRYNSNNTFDILQEGTRAPKDPRDPKHPKDTPPTTEWSNTDTGVKIIKRMFPPTSHTSQAFHNYPSSATNMDSTKSQQWSSKEASLNSRTDQSVQENVSEMSTFSQMGKKDPLKSITSEQVNNFESISPLIPPNRGHSGNPKPELSRTMGGLSDYQPEPIVYSSHGYYEEKPTPKLPGSQAAPKHWFGGKLEDNKEEIRADDTSRMTSGLTHAKSEANLGGVTRPQPIANQASNKMQEPFRTAGVNKFNWPESREERYLQSAKVDDEKFHHAKSEGGLERNGKGGEQVETGRLTGKTFKINLSIVGQQPQDTQKANGGSHGQQLPVRKPIQGGQCGEGGQDSNGRGYTSNYGKPSPSNPPTHPNLPNLLSPANPSSQPHQSKKPEKSPNDVPNGNKSNVKYFKIT